MHSTVIDFLLTRRSVAPKEMDIKRPSDTELEKILRVATRVPDHGKLAPWKIIVFDEAAQKEFGNLVAQRYAALYPEATEAQLDMERARPARAPLMMAVLSTPTHGTIPLFEQQLSAGAVCMNMLHATHALGYGAKWLTEWIAFDTAILSALGGRADNADQIAGFIYIGAIKDPPTERERPALERIVSYWQKI